MKNKNIIPLLFGVVSAAYLVIWFVLRNNVGYGMKGWTAFLMLALICSAISGFTQKKILALAYPIACTADYLINVLIPSLNGDFSFMYSMLPTLIWAIILASAIIWILPNKQLIIGKYLWIVSAGLELIYSLFDIKDLVQYSSYYEEGIPGYYITLDILDLALIIILGLWIYTDYIIMPKIVNGNLETVRNQDLEVSASIQRLTTIKTLLDKGIITQEEFDKKKNEVMGTTSNNQDNTLLAVDEIMRKGDGTDENE